MTPTSYSICMGQLFTDGIGWKSAKGNLRETFEVMDTIYSIDDMENGVMLEVFR